MNVNPYRSNVELLSQRFTFEKIELKEVVEVNEEAKDVVVIISLALSISTMTSYCY